MSDDINKKIGQIADMLSKDELPENLKGLIGLLANSMGKEGPSSKAEETPPAKEDKGEKNDMDENLEMMRKVKKVVDRLNTNNDPRVNLLTAVRPFLNSKRQKHVNNCIKLLTMSSLAKVLDEHDKGDI